MINKLFAFVVLTLVIGGFYVHNGIYNPVDSSESESISISIKKGSTASDVAELLKENDLIKNENLFYGYVRFFGSDSGIIAGRYDLNKTMNVPDILEQISEIGSSEETVTIQEGLTIAQIDDKLFEMELITDDEFENAVRGFVSYDDYWFLDREKIADLDLPLEGYLYPDTYQVDIVDFDANMLIDKMLHNFDTKFANLRAEFETQSKSMHDIITMASILQREVRTSQDFELVSGILWKRLESNWHIGADATILYITRKNTINATDLKLDDPYNTRLHVGMPPGPISNPDISHIKASMNPEDSEYWYYLTTLDTGEVKYARDNDEHNVNKVKYL